MIELIKDNIPDIRFLYDLKDVLYDQEWLKTAPNFEVYYMYRGVSANPKDKQIMDSANLRYDITIIAPQMLGAEYPKTLGHRHAAANNADLTYPEIYEVLQGEGIFLAQKRNNGKIEDTYAVKAQQGEKIIIPPNYEHITINASNKELIMANWSEKNFKSDYRPIKDKKGACYYALSEDGIIKWLKNTNYANIPELKIHSAADFNNIFQKLGIDQTKPMYELVNNVEKLDFLKNPQKYEWK
jgi:glucose-6-phosphate isomerase